MTLTETAATVRIDTPVGPLVLGGDERALHLVLLPDEARAETVTHGARDRALPGPVTEARDQLEEYFAGRRTRFDLTLDPAGTEFQRSVWFALADIPYGRTVSYAELAATVGRPRAFRAVGQANGANPIPIILPCHRVVASGGGIGGYGGGLDLKRRLLALEQRA
jgi:methylated-DNA-[protein]-cysteine S-methyltransferase